MKYVSLDIESTCLQPDPKHILQVSMVIEDTSKAVPVEELPHYTCFVKQERIEGEAYALGMNAWILDYLSGRNKSPCPYPCYTPSGWLLGALNFLDDHFGNEKITVAGKNVAGFDIPFLPKELSSRFRHKVLDPGTLFVNWETDNQVPNFEQCKRRAGIEGPVAHDAREDAMDVIRLLRAMYT